MTGVKTLTAIAAATVVMLVPSCTRIVHDARAVAGEEPLAEIVDENRCTPVDAPLTVIEADAGEPVLKIPQPPQWERITEMDSEVVLFLMRNETLGAVAVLTGDVLPGAGDPDDAFDLSRDGIRDLVGPGGVQDVKKIEHCGLPAESFRFTNPGIGGSGEMPTKAITVVMQLEDEAYLVALQVATPRPDDPVAARDVETILTGFQMLPPTPS